MKKALGILVLAGWCLLFLRCETTEKSMVRAVYLARTPDGCRVGLLYQAPEASADAAEASAALQSVQADGATLAQAIAAAEEELPQTASYRLCDFVLLPDADDTLLTEYEQLILRQGCGRTAAKLACIDGGTESLTEPDVLLDTLKAQAAVLPRLYQHREPMLLPCLQGEGALLHTAAGNRELSDQQAELFALLTNAGGTREFWLDGEKLCIRRCTVSVTLQDGAVFVRLDGQRLPQSPLPTEAQQAQLARQCTELVQECWQQGVDVLHLQAYAALQDGQGTRFDPTKNACPQLRTDVRFLPV